MKLYDTIPHYLLKYLRRVVYPMICHSHVLSAPECEEDLEVANQMIYKLLSQDGPCMIARFGANEMNIVSNYLYISRGDRNPLKYIQGYNGEWWWNDHSIEQLKDCAGVWPATHENAELFARLSIEDSKQIDLLGSWLPGENLLEKELSHAKKVQLFALEPFFAKKPWTRALKGNRVLLVHPFTETIEKQYRRRENIFLNHEILPDFELLTYKSVQSIGGNLYYPNWFEALKKMEDDIDRIDFDIAILGCGAYGLSLAAHIKRSGRKAFHLGGVTQILFGIKGNRWEQPVQNMCKYGYYPDLMNDYWVKPSEMETPINANHVENACYW